MIEKTPRRRATDAERQRTSDLLAEAMSRGQLTVEEFEERSAAAFNARFADELDGLLDDVAPEAPVARARRDEPDRVHDAVAHARDQVGHSVQNASGFSLGILGGTEMKRWTCGEDHLSLAILGGTELDLSDARLESHSTTITAIAICGGIDVLVPEGVRVVCDGAGVLGGFEVSTDRRVRVHQWELPDDAPVVRVTGLALMGGVEVKIVPAGGLP